MRLPSPLYVILDPDAAGGRDLRALLDEVLEGGCRMVQLRDKRTPLAQLYGLAEALQDRCRASGALFVVNDRADLALALGAGGLHVGQDDLPAAEARRLIPSGTAILGVSTHDPAQAKRALADGADYVAVGSIFPTGSKTGFQLVGTALLERLRPEISVPLIGIGGITADNASDVIRAGADGVAVISAVCAAADPRAATGRFMERLERARASRSR